MSLVARRGAAIAAAAVLAAVCPAAASAAIEPGSASDRYMPGNQVIVRVAPGLGRTDARGLTSRIGTRIRRLPLPGLGLFAVPAGHSPRSAARRAARLPGVIYAEPDQVVDYRVLPNDPHFGRQWSLRNTGQQIQSTKGRPGADIGAPTGWDLETGSRSVIVADLDTGADLTHPDLAPNIWVNPGEIPDNHVDDDLNGLTDDVNGWDWADSDNSPDDSIGFDQGHGTQTSSIIGAVGNNGIGIAGVSWEVSLMPLRVATLSDTISAFIYARDQGARVVNFSAGFPFYSRALEDTIDNLGTVLVVNAADNGGFDGEGDNSDRVGDFPCKFRSANLVCVAASNQRDQLTKFTNFGPTSVDLAAPGRNVLGAYPPRAISFDFNEFFDEPIGDRFTGGGRYDRWGLTTKLGGALADTPRGEYRNRTNSFIATPRVDLRQRRACEVSFFIRHRLLAGDRLAVEASRGKGGPWRHLGGFTGTGKGEYQFLRLPARFSGARRARVRFHLRTNASGRGDGVFLDDLQVTCKTTGPTYAYADGTSFAAPQVAGAAALILARFPAASTAEVKERLLAGVDRIPSMAGKLVSGGRLDLARVLP
jgi:subtilisin family serine protease